MLFSQIRIGKDGQPFPVLKFRTMVPDAELRREAILALDEGDGLLFKMRKDPRITTTGTWLRHWSLDELPQLFQRHSWRCPWSDPGHRCPWRPRDTASDVYRRLVVKPGMTGLWQINGRSDLSRGRHRPARPPVRGELDARARSQILWKTCAAVAKGRGAY